MKNDCLFCAIVAGEIPGTKVYEDEFVFAFKARDKPSASEQKSY